MPVRRRASLVVLAAVLAAALLLTVSASASGSSTKIIVSLKFPAFHGKLTSPRQGCLGSRKVKMYREKGGHRKLLGSDKSEDNGKWSIPVGKNLAPGTYYATVASRGKCRAAKSNVLRIE